MLMNKKAVIRNLVLAATLIALSLGMTVAFLVYIQFFRLIPR